MNLDDKLTDYAREGNLLGVMLMLNMGADVHVWDDYVLRYASINGHTDIVKLLEEHMKKGVSNESSRSS